MSFEYPPVPSARGLLSNAVLVLSLIMDQYPLFLNNPPVRMLCLEVSLRVHVPK